MSRKTEDHEQYVGGLRALGDCVRKTLVDKGFIVVRADSTKERDALNSVLGASHFVTRVSLPRSDSSPDCSAISLRISHQMADAVAVHPDLRTRWVIQSPMGASGGLRFEALITPGAGDT
jgi:hypothetical protein